MKKEFVIRGQTVSTAGQNTEVLNFSGYKPGYAYRLVEFMIYPSTNIGGTGYEFTGAVTAAKTAEDSANPDFNNIGLIGTAWNTGHEGSAYTENYQSVINNTFLITQNLILSVGDSSGSALPVNWQCRFESVKMSGPEEAATNYKQFSISDG
jgi:hypothetical protein